MKELVTKTLYFRNGSSDKVYIAKIVADGDGYKVNFAYGRRGATLTPGTKTTEPVAETEARKIFAKLINEKTAKGYTEGEAGTPYVGGDKAEHNTGIVPQLLNVIDEETVIELCADPEFGAQEKFDGKHMLIQATGGKLRAINKRGLECGFPATIQTALAALAERMEFILDGECVGDRYIAFDLLLLHTDYRKVDYQTRHAALAHFFGEAVTVAPLYLTGTGKIQLYRDLQEKNREGIVFKRLSAQYAPGRPASGGDQLKHQFRVRATCQVVQVNDKRSVKLAATGENPASLVNVGNVTIPANHEIPSVGQLVDVQYLYFFRGGSLYQPVYKGRRDDQAMPDLITTLKHKSEE